VRLTHVSVTAVVTLGISAASYAALNPAVLQKRATTVAEQATCRTVNDAIVVYAGVNERMPRTAADLAVYVKGDISAYRIIDGKAAGPGC
jgi:hypothetical protein